MITDEQMEMLKRVELKERRERIATAAMQGLLANPAFVQFAGAIIAKEALEQTDALIKALDEVKP